ncbi:hypothetical protein EW146_g6976 [Bondarzewia mesenterica]|uniref:BRCT domain-containing protein n=1 Tax=Bondarzewia mesenterica TaxID=1095465 RepID=A0A4S4LNX3_9AGAM|nr:hypothetical protein EW146_g6976 [Bondarzewia mesenterica]
MAPAHGRAQNALTDTRDSAPNHGLFLEPMMGTPLAIYIQKDVEDRDTIVDLIVARRSNLGGMQRTKLIYIWELKEYLQNGGVVSQGYSGVPYILVNPHKESGQNLYRQYAGKKTKIVLDARWVHECVRAGALQTFQTNWAGCKVTGTEEVVRPPPPPQLPQPPVEQQTVLQPGPPRALPQATPNAPGIPQQIPGTDVFQAQIPHGMPSVAPPDGMPPSDAPFPYPPYPPQLHAAPRALHTPTAAPPQSWQAANGIAPEQTQTHIAPQAAAQMMPRGPYREPPWDGAYPQAPPPPPNAMVGGPPAQYDYRGFREEQPQWVGGSNDYYDQSVPYEQNYDQSYMNEGGPSNQPSETVTEEIPRGRRRTRAQPAPAPPASTLVMNQRNPQARSPTPPSRVIKSTYGGNLFTADDVLYLKKYIDYCQEQGQVLSLREICERVAVKAPHHTFYSWRRYCNKHQIRLGGYAMNMNRMTGEDGDDGVNDEQRVLAGPGPGAISAAKARVMADGQVQRTRSPTPPRALYRSTTGKGVAFTDEDVTFLIRLLEYRKSQGKLDMVTFWKEMATKAPHHSRASWMKFYRRHKHELNHTEQDEPLPQPPEKKMRYSWADDILLAKYFYSKPEGTSDKIFQAFGRLHPHHPWKGWQEHHRIHKAKIDHLISRLANGEVIEDTEAGGE